MSNTKINRRFLCYLWLNTTGCSNWRGSFGSDLLRYSWGSSCFYHQQGASSGRAYHQKLHPYILQPPTAHACARNHTHLPTHILPLSHERERRRNVISLEGQTISDCWRNAWHTSQLREESKTDRGRQTHAQGEESWVMEREWDGFYLNA